MPGLVLLGVVIGAWLAIGGVHHVSRAGLHGGLALGLGLCAALHERSLRNAGKVVPLAKAVAVLLGACAIGLLPLPRLLRLAVAPANVAARPDFGWWTLSLDPELTIGELCDLLLPLGALVLAVAWGAVWWRRTGIERAMRWALVAVCAVGAVHAVSGATALFGLVPTSLAPPARFYAPFIDPNHLGTAIALLLPGAASWAGSPETPRRERIAWGIVCVVAVGFVVVIGSSGALAAVIVAGFALAWRARSSSAAGGVGAGVGVGALAGIGGASVVAAGALWAIDPDSGVTLRDRMVTWTAAIQALPGWWFAGSGGGTFESALQPRLASFTGWAHAHMDPLEWVVEHGLLGVVAAGVAWMWLRPSAVARSRRQEDEGIGPNEAPSWPARWQPRADAWTIAVLAVAVHALVDFPLQIPALAIGAAVAWGLRRGAYEPRVEVPPATVRAILGVLAALELAACGWEARAAAVDAAVLDVQAHGLRARSNASATLRRWAPWRAENEMLEAWSLEAANPAGAAVLARALAADHPDDPRALRVAGRILGRAGLADEARAAYDRSIERFPGDWRTWVARAADAPDDLALASWQEAFAHGAPARYVALAWRELPVGLVWLDVGAQREARFSVSLGAFLAAHDDRETAALAYEQAYLIDPDEPPHAGYAQVLIALGRIDAAERFVAAGLAVRPDDLGLQQQQAELLEHRDRFDDAADAWVRLADRRPQALARALRAIERGQGAAQAVKYGERLSLTRTLDPAAVLELARMRRDIGDYVGCSTDVERSGLMATKAYGVRARALRDGCAAALR